MSSDATKFQITRDIRAKIREIIPKVTDTLEIARVSGNSIIIYAVWKGIRIARAKYVLKIGDSVFINNTTVTIDFDD